MSTGTPWRMEVNRYALINLIMLIATSVLMSSGCGSLPTRIDHLPFEQALTPAEAGPIADISDRFIANNEPQSSGFRLLVDSQAALESRLALIDLARRSIDLQYFIWKGDESGVLLFNRLLQAADRGVKVRIIVDDIWLASTTRNLAALNSHPNLEIRIFNPNPSRDHLLGGLLHFLASFQELNRRMHNKLMIVDNHALIAGGRNIGNEYFGLGTQFNFLDIDVLTVGAVVKESSHAFDEYWNDNAVYPVSGWNVELPESTIKEVQREISSLLNESKALLVSYPLHQIDWQEWLDTTEDNLSTGSAHFLQDDPVQIDGRNYRLIDMISYFANPTEDELVVVSPYLIPVDNSLKELRNTFETGVSIKLLTNSLASTNHTLVNSHYKKYRRQILATGADLYEFQHHPSTELRAKADVAPITAPFISLHAKVIVADRRRCFIGSLNFDPRAIVINSENGLLIESPELATELTDLLVQMMGSENSWQLTINQENRIQWQSSERVLTAQPARGFFQSLGDFFGRFLPVESQL